MTADTYRMCRFTPSWVEGDSMPIAEAEVLQILGDRIRSHEWWLFPMTEKAGWPLAMAIIENLLPGGCEVLEVEADVPERSLAIAMVSKKAVGPGDLAALWRTGSALHEAGHAISAKEFQDRQLIIDDAIPATARGAFQDLCRRAVGR